MNTRVGIDISSEEFWSDYDAVVLAIGMSKVPMLGIEGEALTGVYDAIDFVESTKTEPDLGYDIHREAGSSHWRGEYSD